MRFDFPLERRVKIPQMGWNQVDLVREHPILTGVGGGHDFYFVHSFYPVVDDPNLVVATTDYEGCRFPSVVGRDNLVAAQFHPEKSGRVGLAVLKNFLEWDGRVC